MHTCEKRLISVCLKMRVLTTCNSFRKRLVSFPARVLRKLTLWLSRAARKQVQNKVRMYHQKAIVLKPIYSSSGREVVYVYKPPTTKPAHTATDKTENEKAEGCK